MKLTDMTVEDLFDDDQFKMHVSINCPPEAIYPRVALLFLERNENELKEYVQNFFKSQVNVSSYLRSIVKELKQDGSLIDKYTVRKAVSEYVKDYIDINKEYIEQKLDESIKKIIEKLPSSKSFRQYFTDAVSESRQAKIDALKKELSILEGKEEES